MEIYSQLGANRFSVMTGAKILLIAAMRFLSNCQDQKTESTTLKLN
jgi:hypothetical protein